MDSPRPELALTYTSTDASTGPGGWQVVQTRPADADVSDLVSHVRAWLRPVEPLPPFPTNDERKAFTRRMEHRPLSGGRSGIWHTVPAGRDASGRPGNVFVSAAALSGQDASHHHAIDFWRSRSWPEPFGAAEVSKTSDNPQSLIPGPNATPAAVAAHLFPPFPEHPRRGLLAGLQDAVQATVDGQGLKVALLVGHADEAASWIGAICAWAVPAWTRRFSWSTWERADDLAHPAVDGLHLVAVPFADEAAAGLRHCGRLVIDSRVDQEALEDQALLPSGAATRRFSSGAEIPISQWSRETWKTLQQGREAVAAKTADLRVAVAATFRGEKAEEALVALRDIADPASLGDPASYLRRVLGDRDWLGAAPGPSPAAIPPSHPETPGIVDFVTETLGGLNRELESEPGSVVLAVVFLRTADFALNCGLHVEPAASWNAVLEVLGGRQGGAVARECQPLGSRTLRESLLASLGPTAGAEIRNWLGGQQPPAGGGSHDSGSDSWPHLAGAPSGRSAGSGSSSSIRQNLFGRKRKPHEEWIRGVVDLRSAFLREYRRIEGYQGPAASAPSHADLFRSAGRSVEQYLRDAAIDPGGLYTESPAITDGAVRGGLATCALIGLGSKVDPDEGTLTNEELSNLMSALDVARSSHSIDEELIDALRYHLIIAALLFEQRGGADGYRSVSAVRYLLEGRTTAPAAVSRLRDKLDVWNLVPPPEDAPALSEFIRHLDNTAVPPPAKRPKGTDA